MKLNQIMRDLLLDIKSTRMHAIKIGCNVTGGGKTFRGRNSYDTHQGEDASQVPDLTASLTCPITFSEFGESSRRKR